MQIGIVAKKIGLSVDAIRFYERNALLPRPPRTQGGFRRYSESDVDTLAFIRRVQGLGFNSARFGRLLNLRGNRLQPCAPVRHRLEEKLSDVQRKLADLHKLEHELRLALRSCNKELPASDPLIAQFERNKQQQTGERQVRLKLAKAGPTARGSGALLVGGLAAILASTCCLGPLVSGRSRLERRVDRKPHAARTISSSFYRWFSSRLLKNLLSQQFLG